VRSRPQLGLDPFNDPAMSGWRCRPDEVTVSGGFKGSGYSVLIG
jgi:hypothetical protein